jgi:hypothetical protein
VGADGQAGGAGEQHGYGHEDETVGDRCGRDAVSGQPAAYLVPEPVIGAVGEERAGADDPGPQERVAPFGGAGRLAGRAAAEDPEQGEGNQAADHSGSCAGKFDGQSPAVGGDLLDKQRDDGCRQQDRPQQAELGDLAVRSEVGFQHGGQDEDVDDFGVHEHGHLVAPFVGGVVLQGSPFLTPSCGPGPVGTSAQGPDLAERGVR